MGILRGSVGVEWLPQKYARPARPLAQGGLWDKLSNSIVLFCMFCGGAMDSQEQKLYKKTSPKRPLDVVHLGISFVQKWTLLMKPLEKERIRRMVELVLQRAKEFRPSLDTVSDVGFI
jgi:hypothetical protein